MSYRIIPIPDFIKAELKNHILSSCSNAEAGWEDARADEDTITGDFFGNLRTPWKRDKNFEWRFGYKKIPGRGQGALEKPSGTDGIITIHYIDQVTGKVYYKSLVFQAKKFTNTVNKEQRQKMKDHFPKGNIVLTYGPSGYSALDENDKSSKICDLIANDFLDCKIGIPGLHYDPGFKKFVDANKKFPGKLKHISTIEVRKVWS